MGSLMTAVHNTNLSATPSAVEVNRFAADGVCLSTLRCADATVVTVMGELDACNIDHLTTYVGRCLAEKRPLVVDLSQLSFLAAQGIRTLFELGDACVQSRIDWALMPGRAVSRLLRICDTESRLPTVSSIHEALQGFSAPAEARKLLQLVTKST